jgi:hypothetical protein
MMVWTGLKALLGTPSIPNGFRMAPRPKITPGENATQTTPAAVSSTLSHANHLQRLTETADVEVYVRALQTNGSPSLRLFVDGVDKGAKTITNSGAPEPYTWDVNVPPGTHTLRLKASNTGTERNPLIDVLRFPAEPLPPPPSNLLSWAPPTLTNPITVDVPANDTRYGNAVTKVVLASGQDARINLPSTAKVGGLWIEGGRNVIVIGGHIQPNPNHSKVSGSLGIRGFYVKNNTGTVHIEGTLITNPDDREFDAMEIDSGATTLQLENNRWLGVGGTRYTNHGDVLQPYGTGVKNVRIDQLTATRRYQGLQLYDAYNHGFADIRNVDITGLTQTEGTSGGQLIWVGASAQVSPYTFRETYVKGRPSLSFGYSVWPNVANSAHPAVLAAGGLSLSWPSFPQITGGVKLGPPPSGEFVPAGAAGVGYVSPGYQ